MIGGLCAEVITEDMTMAVINKMKNLILGVVLFGTVMYAFYVGVSKHERAECLRWQAEAENITEYHVARWQAHQCENYGIQLPVQKISRM